MIFRVNTIPLPLSGLSADDKLIRFLFLFPDKIGFDISCKLSSEETIYKKSQNLFSGKNKKIISKCRVQNFSMLSFNMLASSER